MNEDTLLTIPISIHSLNFTLAFLTLSETAILALRLMRQRGCRNQGVRHLTFINLTRKRGVVAAQKTVGILQGALQGKVHTCSFFSSFFACSGLRYLLLAGCLGIGGIICGFTELGGSEEG